MHTGKLISELSSHLSLSSGNVLAMGLDLVHIPRMEESLRDFGERFEDRLFTSAEVEYARSAPLLRTERLAARFAAKEATIKALSLGHEGVDWREIEVTRQEDGSCSMALHGKAAAALTARGGSRLLVCMSHDGDYAAAVVAVLSDT